MPIEIRELVIRAQVEPCSSQAPSPDSAPSADRHSQEDLIRQCVQEVLRILADQRER